MKKLLLTAAIILGLATTTFADPNGGGLFKRGETPENSMATRYENGETPVTPGHGQTGNQNGEAPLGTGIVVLLGLGVAYLIGKKRSEE